MTDLLGVDVTNLTCALPECDEYLRKPRRGKTPTWCKAHNSPQKRSPKGGRGGSRRAARISKLGDAPCAQCGSRRPEASASLYCSKSCQNRRSYERRREQVNAQQRAITLERRMSVMRTCLHCREPIPPSRSMSAIYCSKLCSRRAARFANSRRCSIAGCDRPHNARGLCQMHYRREARREGREATPKWDAKRKARWQARYAAKRGDGTASPIDHEAIFDRDGWLCGICHEQVDRELKWPDPKSVSLDHIVPLSRGGTHTPENVQCAHLACNVSKGNRSPVAT